MFRLIALLIGYSLGSIQMAYIIGRLKGIDIREHGSKNAGMTNVTRTIGKRAGAFVFVFDIVKCIVAFVLGTLIFGGEGAFFPYVCECEMGCFRDMHGIMPHVLPGIYAGIGAVLGHCFPVWLKFRGGKGVSCALALILMIDWRVALLAFAVGVVAVAVKRYISLASLGIMLVTPVLMWLFGYGIEAVALMAGLTALIWFMHRENIKRLLNGTERKFLEKKES
ncbi:MAG: glycerol-3-phosphate 1-O-acyltransferase PlsY [Defluviitaleaceae bacterium]|nr:glycerol-3-phosphate 1-O-acyltransferase PlsY [Defluviitaleaceae bacterium]MCL2262165.1 glycerol-3-phosphate 1-O-acyltransferase PlsY [Defluviitaleaceae bacterium]